MSASVSNASTTNAQATSVDAEALLQRIAGLIDAGRGGVARPLLAAARRLSPPSARLSHLAARLALREGALDEATAELNEAVTLDPLHAGLRICRADLRERCGDLDGATRDAAEAVILDRHDPVAKAALGGLMIRLGRFGDAASCLGEAVTAAPRDAPFREALATAQEAGGDPDTALATLVEGIALTPTVVALRNAAILLCVRGRRFDQAVQLAEQARQVGIADACTFGLCGHALSAMGRHDEATGAYVEALKLGPEDDYVRHLVMASRATPSALRAPADYVRTVFDGYADRFESHLVALGYRIPGLIRSALREHPAIMGGRSLGPVLDLGCGTGFAALAISDLPLGPITGVDLSARMLAHAAAKQIYAELIEGDLVSLLAAERRNWPLILAADVFCYFGALDTLLGAIHPRMEPGGWLIFSVEALLADHNGTVPGNGAWALHRQGRYAHAHGYVREAAAAAGFREIRYEEQTVRNEANAPVPGLFVVLERPRLDA
ncbi:MAG TPA: methyltransferase domain-containing protein [Acetobacteraceae bacterium]|nr:methyltransferase domain-containing protein [Acetobacteraceae bacterium]